MICLASEHTLQAQLEKEEEEFNISIQPAKGYDNESVMKSGPLSQWHIWLRAKQHGRLVQICMCCAQRSLYIRQIRFEAIKRPQHQSRIIWYSTCQSHHNHMHYDFLSSIITTRCPCLRRPLESYQAHVEETQRKQIKEVHQGDHAKKALLSRCMQLLEDHASTSPWACLNRHHG